MTEKRRSSNKGEEAGEEDLCPLCLEELDITDRSFKPCQCGYQMCRFCWHHIKENLNSKCPACRSPYDPENYTFNPPDPKEIAKMVSHNKKSKNRRDYRKRKKKKTQRLVICFEKIWLMFG